MCGASGEGKTHLLSQLITQTYSGCFEAIYLWSPSANLDPGYDAIRAYVEKKLDPDEEWIFDHYDPDDLKNVIDNQAQIIKLMKEKKKKRFYSICIIVDDFSDSPDFTRNSKQLWSLFARGRHLYISTYVLSQRWRSLAPIIRLNASVVYLHRVRNSKDYEAIGEELAGERGKDALISAYKMALNDRQYSFFKIDLMTEPKYRWQIRMDERYI